MDKLTQLLIVATCLALAGCASTGEASPTATPPPQPMVTQAAAIAPTGTPVPSATSAASSTPRPTLALDQPAQTEPPAPENTPISTATNYPAPTVPLSPAGPWLVFRAGCYLWAINQDGTGLTRISNERVLSFAVRPTSTVQGGLAIAYTTYPGDVCQLNDYWYSSGDAIKLLSWPSGDLRTVIYGRSEELKWSPNGSRLTFTAQVDASDTNSNVFVYDTATGQSTRIAVTEHGDYRLRWSPDERYVLFESYHPGMVGVLTNAIWSARADAGGVTQLAHGVIDDDGWIVEDLGWLSPTEIIMQWDNAQWGEDEIRIANIETGQYTTLISEPHPDVAYSPEHNLLLMTKDIEPAPNRLLIFYQNGERREVTGHTIKYVEWLSAYDVFLGQTPDGHAYLITPEGTVTEIPSPGWKVESPHSVIVSRDRQWWAWHTSWNRYQKRAGQNSELWVGTAMSQPTVFLSFSEVVPDFRVYRGDVIWSPNSQHLLWLSHGQDLWAASPPNFEAIQVLEFPGNYYATFSDAVWVQ